MLLLTAVAGRSLLELLNSRVSDCGGWTETGAGVWEPDAILRRFCLIISSISSKGSSSASMLSESELVTASWPSLTIRRLDDWELKGGAESVEVDAKDMLMFSAGRLLLIDEGDRTGARREAGFGVGLLELPEESGLNCRKTLVDPLGKPASDGSAEGKEERAEENEAMGRFAPWADSIVSRIGDSLVDAGAVLKDVPLLNKRALLGLGLHGSRCCS